MVQTVSVTFTLDELQELFSALQEIADRDRAFVRVSPGSDVAFTHALLKVGRARVTIGETKGVELHLPPWAALPILDGLVAAGVVTVPPPAKPKRVRKPRKLLPRRRTPRRRRSVVPPVPSPRVAYPPDEDGIAGDEVQA